MQPGFSSFTTQLGPRTALNFLVSANVKEHVKLSIVTRLKFRAYREVVIPRAVTRRSIHLHSLIKPGATLTYTTKPPSSPSLSDPTHNEAMSHGIKSPPLPIAGLESSPY